LFEEHLVIFKTRYYFSEEFIWTTSLNFRTEDYTAIAVMEFDGKGIVGSLKTLIADSILTELVQDRKIFHTGDIIKYLKEELDAAGSNELYCDINASVALIDNNAKTLQFSGLNQDMIMFQNGKMVLIEGDSLDDIDMLKADKYDVSEEDSFYLFSNGFYNQANIDGVKFSREKFEEMLKAIQSQNMNYQESFLNQTIEDWIGDGGMTDDISVIGFKLKF
jgi:hypothetical protein